MWSAPPCSQRWGDVAGQAVEARRLYIGASVFRCGMTAMQRVRKSEAGVIGDAPMAWHRARGGSLEADMVLRLSAPMLWVYPERKVLTERERLFATAALNSSGLPIMSSNRVHL